MSHVVTLHVQVITLKMHELQLLNVYKSHNVMSLLRDKQLVSCDRSFDLIRVLSGRTILFECLQHNHLSLRQVPM